MIYKRDWIISWNDVYQIANVCMERIPVHLWCFNYLLSIPHHILGKIPIIDLNFIVKPLYRVYKRNFVLYKRKTWEDVEKGGSKWGIKSLLKDIFHALFYPIREINLWLNSKRYRFGDWGEWFYQSKIVPFELYMDKQTISVAIPMTMDTAKKSFPNEYKVYLEHNTEIDLNINKNIMTGYSKETDGLFNIYLDRFRIDQMVANIKELSTIKIKSKVKSCKTCSRNKLNIFGTKICQFKIESECGVIDFPLWEKI